ncbi:MAG: hypothetical protein ACK55O_14370 [Phycisphaerales bacterium]|jgi:hypothetical protein|nr:hypothetical protein [Phycisphaeraceae bacterium]MTA11621.1 hypothetical protein [Actinomycetota bacterium]
MITLDELMHAACRQYSHGVYAVTTPFVLNGWEYATDLALCIRRRTDTRDSKPGAGERFPNVESLNWSVNTQPASPIVFDQVPPVRTLGPSEDPDDNESPRRKVAVRHLCFNQDYLQALTLAGGVIHEPQRIAEKLGLWGITVVGSGWQAICMRTNPPGDPRYPDVISAVVPLRRLIRRHLDSQAAKGAER